MACIKLTNGTHVDIFPSHYTTKDILQDKVSYTGRNDKEDPFYIVDLGKLIQLHKHVWLFQMVNLLSYVFLYFKFV